MPGIGIRNLVNKGTDYSINFIEQFIKSSTNIKNSIKGYTYNSSLTDEEDQEKRMNMIIALVRDTYVCNLLFGYSGMMRFISDDSRYEQIDVKLLNYVRDFYNDAEFRTALGQVYSRYRDTYEQIDLESYPEHYQELEIIRFLERIIDRLQIEGKRANVHSCISTLESRIYNLLNVTPLLTIDSKYLNFRGADKIEITGKKKKKNGDSILEVPLHYDNYTLLMDNISSNELRHAIELRYISRTESTLKDFADLVIYRKLFATEMGYHSYFQYVSRDKKDTSDAIKKLIITLNEKIEDQTRVEMLNVYDYFNRRSNKNPRRITNGDIEKYIKIHANKQTYDKYVVMYYLFKLIRKYFNVTIRRYDLEDGEEFANFKSFELVANDEVLGRLYIDIDQDENKKIVEPISIKVSDRMMISEGMYSTPEVVLLANYGDQITYYQIVSLFKEFGYVLQELCYRSSVGLVNRDPEFSNFMPLVMENIAWDHSTVEMICQDQDVASHTLSMRYYDICTRLKKKCIYAKFDHLLHNSDEIINLLFKVVNEKSKPTDQIKGDVTKTIVELYQTIHRESFAGVSDILDIPEDLALASIDPMAVVLEINGSQGYLYSNLMNEIFAYACFHILKNGLRTPEQFRRVILEDGITPFRDLISDFIRIDGLNTFHLYLTELIGIPDERHANMSITPHTDQTPYSTDNPYDYINTEYDSNFNHFDDKPIMETEQSEDKGSIIRINRV